MLRWPNSESKKQIAIYSNGQTNAIQYDSDKKQSRLRFNVLFCFTLRRPVSKFQCDILFSQWPDWQYILWFRISIKLPGDSRVYSNGIATTKLIHTVSILLSLARSYSQDERTMYYAHTVAPKFMSTSLANTFRLYPIKYHIVQVYVEIIVAVVVWRSNDKLKWQWNEISEVKVNIESNWSDSIVRTTSRLLVWQRIHSRIGNRRDMFIVV